MTDGRLLRESADVAVSPSPSGRLATEAVSAAVTPSVVTGRLATVSVQVLLGAETGASLAGSVSTDVGVRGRLHQHRPLAARSTLVVDPRGSIRFSKYLRSRVGAEVSMLGRIGVTPDPLRSRLSVGVGVSGRLAVRVALQGASSVPVRIRGDLRVPYSVRLFSKPVSLRLGMSGLLRVRIPPPNDLFANAAPLSGLTGQTTGSNVNSTVEPGEPIGGHSVWWVWTSKAGGTATFSTFGSGFPAQLEVYVGSSVTSLTEISTGVGGSTRERTFAAIAGGVYYLRVFSNYDDESSILLSWSVETTSLFSWTADQSQRFLVDVEARGLLQVRPAVAPPPRRYDPLLDPTNPDSPASVARREEAIRVHRYSLTFPPVVVGADGFPRAQA